MKFSFFIIRFNYFLQLYAVLFTISLSLASFKKKSVVYLYALK